MEPIFHDGKKSCVGDQNLEIKQNDLQQSTVFWEGRYSAFATWFNFFVNKNKNNYNAKLSTKLILKKNQQR